MGVGLSAPASQDIVDLLHAVRHGSRAAVDKLLPTVYAELRRLALCYLSKERSDHTLQPTALVHEAYLRLVGQRSVGWEDRTQFFAAAATVMRRVLVDHARARNATKRGGGRRRTALDDVVTCFEERACDLVALNEALERLAAMDGRKAQVVELRFFGGFSVEEAAKFIGIPRRTAEREWTLAKAWLRGELHRSEDRAGPAENGGT